MLQRKKNYKELDINGAENISAYLTSLNEKWNCGMEIKHFSKYDCLIGLYQSFKKLYFIVGIKRRLFKNKNTGICYSSHPSIPQYPKDSIFYGLKVYDNCKEIEMYFYGVIDWTGEITVPVDYEAISFCTSTYIYASKEGKFGVLDLDGHEIIPLKFDELYRYSEGLIGARSNNKIGFIDGLGKEVIPFIYDAQEGEEYYFHDGLACVAKEEKDCVCYGYINHANEEIFSFKYGFFSPMIDGTCINLTHESMIDGYTNDEYLLIANGEMKLIDTEFINTSEDYIESEDDYYEKNDDDKMDAYEGDYDALWNTD